MVAKIFYKITFAAALSFASLSANAGIFSYDYQANITAISNSSAFAGATIGGLFSGTFSYDTSNTSIIPQFSYSDSNGSGARLSLNGTDNSISATLPGIGNLNALLDLAEIRGGSFTADNNSWYSYNLRTTNSNFSSNPGSASFMLILTNFGTNASGPAFISDSLPNSLNYSDVPSTYGSISYITGTLPTSSSRVYLIDRYQAYSNFFCVSGCSAPGTWFGPGAGFDDPTYQAWLSEGNTPLYRDTLSFNVSSFSVAAVPEADTYAMLLTGLGVMGFIARRRKNTQA